MSLQIGNTIYANETLIVEQCCNCSIYFALPQSMRERLLDIGGSFYCPNGHGQHYSKPRNQELKDKIASLERANQRAHDYIQEKNHQITQLGYSVRALKAAKTKIINRVKNGVCPCCNRTFQDLQRH